MILLKRLAMFASLMVVLCHSMTGAHAAADPVVLRVYTAPPIQPSAVPNKPAKGAVTGPLAAAFNISSLKALPQHTFVAQTPWYKTL